jgi:histidyl-tRNA synthetase
VSPSAAKFGKQIQYADKRGIPFVWFPGADEDGTDGDGEVKDIRSGEQVPADADSWNPPADDLKPRIVRG